MLGDELLIKQAHTDRARDICDVLDENYRNFDKLVVTVAGESGSGKSEVASEISRLRSARGEETGVLQQDDYFVFPPKTNHEMRKKNIDQVGLFEVKLDFLDSNLRSFKRGRSTIYKPLVIYDEDRITSEVMEVGDFQALIAEGTYTSALEFADCRVFIDRDYHQTYESRQKRGRDKLEPFVEDVLEREHEIISPHRKKADVIIRSDYSSVELLV